MSPHYECPAVLKLSRALSRSPFPPNHPTPLPSTHTHTHVQSFTRPSFLSLYLTHNRPTVSFPPSFPPSPSHTHPPSSLSPSPSPAHTQHATSFCPTCVFNNNALRLVAATAGKSHGRSGQYYVIVYGPAK